MINQGGKIELYIDHQITAQSQLQYKAIQATKLILSFPLTHIFPTWYVTFPPQVPRLNVISRQRYSQEHPGQVSSRGNNQTVPVIGLLLFQSHCFGRQY